RRVRERAGKLDPDAAVRVFRESGGVGQLPEPAAVGAHGEQLTAVDARMERVARGVEDDRFRHRVLNVELPPDGALRGTIHPACGDDVRRRTSRVEMGDLAQAVATGVDGEYLAVSEGVLPERVGGGREERAPPGHARERVSCVHAVELRQLEEILAVLD